MELKVLEFINTNDNWEELLSAEPYNLIIKWKSPFVLLKYNQLNSDMSNEIVQECRGLILKQVDSNKFKVASMRFTKFFNYGEDKAAKLDFSEPVVVSQKIDGSLIGLWMDNDSGVLHISTSGNIDAEDAEIQFQTDTLHTYKDLFLEAWKKCNNLPADLDNNCTYMFELVSPYNRVIVPYKESKIYLLGSRNNITLEEKGFWEIEQDYFETPRHFECSNIKEIEEAVEKLSVDDEHFEGFVVCDKHYNRIKMKSTKYIELFFVKGDGVFSEKKILKIILNEEDDDILGYFPEYTDDFDRIRRALSIWIQGLKDDLEVCMDKLSLDRKTFAEWAKTTLYPSIIFKAYDKGSWDADWLQEQVEAISIDNLLNLVKKEK